MPAKSATKSNNSTKSTNNNSLKEEKMTVNFEINTSSIKKYVKDFNVEDTTWTIVVDPTNVWENTGDIRANRVASSDNWPLFHSMMNGVMKMATGRGPKHVESGLVLYKTFEEISKVNVSTNVGTIRGGGVYEGDNERLQEISRRTKAGVIYRLKVEAGEFRIGRNLVHHDFAFDDDGNIIGYYANKNELNEGEAQDTIRETTDDVMEELKARGNHTAFEEMFKDNTKLVANSPKGYKYMDKLADNLTNMTADEMVDYAIGKAIEKRERTWVARSYKKLEGVPDGLTPYAAAIKNGFKGWPLFGDPSVKVMVDDPEVIRVRIYLHGRMSLQCNAGNTKAAASLYELYGTRPGVEMEPVYATKK